MAGGLWLCRGIGTDPYENLALEQHLLETVAPGDCILYLWQNQNTVVIGRNQNPWVECRTQLFQEEGGHLSRRLSGGGAVFHDLGNLNFTFLVHKADYDVGKQTEVLLRACREMGIPAERSGRNDLLADGRKFSGNAFYEHLGRCYHHGTLLVDVDMEKMGRYLQPSQAKLESKGVASVRSRVVNLRTFVPGLTIEDLAGQLERTFSAVYGGEVHPLPAEALDRARLEELTAHNRSWDWLWGRKMAFTLQPQGRFPWGEVTVGLTVDRGVVEEATVYTDAMDWAFAAPMGAALAGCPFTPEKLRAAVETVPCDENIRRDIGDLLAQQF